jgi:hypothetical protein
MTVARVEKPERIGASQWQEWVAYAVALEMALDDEAHNRASAARGAQRYRSLVKDAAEYLDALGENEMADKYRSALRDGESYAVDTGDAQASPPKAGSPDTEDSE